MTETNPVGTWAELQAAIGEVKLARRDRDDARDVATAQAQALAENNETIGQLRHACQAALEWMRLGVNPRLSPSSGLVIGCLERALKSER